MFRLLRILPIAALILLLAAGLVQAAFHTITGPSSSQSLYIVPVADGVRTFCLLTVGDSVNNEPDGSPYRLVGVPDGLGAFDNGDGTFTLLMNHELRDSVGVVRAHGAKGAFVSKWTISQDTLQVLHGEDLIQQIVTWNAQTGQYDPPAKGVAISRLCSADLPASSAFFQAASGLGYSGRIFMNGEESGAEGRAFANLMDGTSYELPWLGRFSWENSVASPASGVKTIVVGLDDSDNGQVYVYVGTKTSSGSAIDKAGLTNGRLYGVKVEGWPLEDPATGIPSGTRFSLYDLGDVSYLTGAELEDLSNANGGTGFQRPEDGAWDPNSPSDFYFATTASFSGNSRLRRLKFDDPSDPVTGGTMDMLLDGSEGQKMMDNLDITAATPQLFRGGEMLIQEDPGNQAHIAKVWRYTNLTGSLEMIAQHDPDRFTPGAPAFLTQDEESSGIVDVSDILGRGWVLLDVQAHYDIGDPELVEGGQLLALFLPPAKRFP